MWNRGDTHKSKFILPLRLRLSACSEDRDRGGRQDWTSGASNWLKGCGAVSGSRSAAAQQWHSNPLISTLTKRKGRSVCNTKKPKQESFFFILPNFLSFACINLHPCLFTFISCSFIFTPCFFRHTVYSTAPCWACLRKELIICFACKHRTSGSCWSRHAVLFI